MTPSFTTDRMLTFGDCDISGTAYFPAYLNILNGVVEEFWAKIGFAWHEVIPREGWGTPTVHLSCDFTRPSVYGDRLTFRLTVLRVGRSSVRLRHEVTCAQERRWSAEQVLVASLLAQHSPLPWPDAVRARLEAFVAPQAAADIRP